MKYGSGENQGGYTLLLFVIVLMGMGGIALGGYSQSARETSDHQRYLHNKRVLEEAKRALLMYAYNYPFNNPDRGPGRMPCPDRDNDGSPESLPNCNTGTGIVGRFPWNGPNMDFYDARDASGERLWYAVSQDYAYNIQPLLNDVINTDSTGTITIYDQSGNLMYDGGAAGIAAVIIAPGPVTDRNGVFQDRSVANADDRFDTTADTDPGIVDPINYLDIFGALDNADFTNTSSVDGFIMGPVFAASGNVIVNDQMILITAEEVNDMAQKATLQAYRNAIGDYQQKAFAGVVANYRYPWMNAYAGITDLNIYDVVPGQIVGRVPYLNYFADRDSHILITDLLVDYDIDLNLDDSAELFNTGYINAFNVFFSGVLQTLDISAANLSFKKQTFDLSANLITDNLGTLISAADVSTVLNSPASITRTLFFWDGCVGTCPQPEDGWEVCPVNIGDETDCARNPAGTAFEPFTNWAVHADQKIRMVRLQFNFDAEFEIGFNYANLPVTPPIYVAPTAAANAVFTRDALEAAVTNLVVDVDASIVDTQDFIDTTVVICEQDNDVGNNFNIFFYGNDDSDSAYCTPVITAVVAVNQLNISADYFPELPVWVRRNNWNDSILMAYADDFKPGTVAPAPCVATPPCLTVAHNFNGLTVNNASLFVGANRIPANVADLGLIFEGENSTPLDDIFDARPTGGDDVVLVLDES